MRAPGPPNNRCGQCHQNGNASGGLSLAVGVARANLVNIATGCNGAVVRVKPSDVANSMLLRKLSNAANKCGNQMPPSNNLKAISAADYATIERWVAEGALNN